MKELAVISGNGDAGKTSIVSSFAALAGRAVLADCDVDADHEHLADFCPDAIGPAPVTSGECFVSGTRYGPMVYANPGAAEADPGKLVSIIRAQAERIAEQSDRELILIDGATGVGCPVIASIVGADLVVVVTEPTCAGMEDLHRASDLTRHFGIDTLVCVNKWDVNPGIAFEIVDWASERHLTATEMIRYDRSVIESHARARPVVESGEQGAAADLRRVWETVCWALAGTRG